MMKSSGVNKSRKTLLSTVQSAYRQLTLDSNFGIVLISISRITDVVRVELRYRSPLPREPLLRALPVDRTGRLLPRRQTIAPSSSSRYWHSSAWLQLLHRREINDGHVCRPYLRLPWGYQ